MKKKPELTVGHRRDVVELAERTARELGGELCFKHGLRVHVHLFCARCGRDHGDLLEFQDLAEIF